MKLLIALLLSILLASPVYAQGSPIGFSNPGGAGASLANPVTAATGGTGSAANTGTSGTILRGNGTAFVQTNFTVPASIALGKIFRASSANTVVESAYVMPAAAGTQGKVLQSADGTDLAMSGFTLPTTNGVTGSLLRYSTTTSVVGSTFTIPDTFAAGDIIYATSTNTLGVLPKGAALSALRMNAGATAPEWFP